MVFMGGEVPEWCLSGWDTYAMASVGNRRLNLPCHYASTDDYRAMWIALETLAARGYRRPGLAMERSQHVIRSDYRGLAAFLAWHAQRGETRPPLCWTEKWDRGEFSRWRERERPDVVLAIERAPLDFLREAGAEVPGEVGFAHLDLDETTEGISGIRQLNREAGRSAAHLVIDQINRVTYGRPAHPRSIQITGEWCDGGTVAGLKT
ncbi:MAG: hypothetical protein LBR12_04140 [Opitutaceae bacterium]|nr:hypothetical protein [Opitutaceae bacterium]